MAENSQSSDSKVFSVRIVSIDYYMAPPIPGMDFCYSSFQGGNVNEVPVIRVYGSTPAGQKTCLHIHRALPYLYVACSDLSLRLDQEGDACTHILSYALEKALKLKGNVGSKRQHVHGCSLVRARKFYGYHSSEEPFIKIFLYRPQDVSRAANLLLGGAVLDKILQPYESHIPFLLQFLVDYNLNGMGLLHLSEMKFRLPLPDVFSRRKANYNGEARQQNYNSACMSAEFQADSSVDTCSNSPIWISSTIPDGWIWQCFSPPDVSTVPNIPFAKRQSNCELEGDASVDEILNQQFKLFTSLSQIHSEVGMVQSLVPIWEEEFERTGMHEVPITPDPGKPVPEDVLRILSYGLEFDNKLNELCRDAENFLSSGQAKNDVEPVISSTDEGCLVKFKNINAEYNRRDSLKCLKAHEELGFLSSDTLFEGRNSEEPGEGRDACSRKMSVDELPIPDSTKSPDIKLADRDALTLLKWLASSQASEDLNSDDELAHEIILSPFVRATTMDGVLEKANVDYESKSQQECKDILDSVEVTISFEGSKGKTNYSTNFSMSSGQTLLDQTIRQLDGCADDLRSIPPTTKLPDAGMNGEWGKSLQEQLRKEFSLSATYNKKRKRPLWGSLPFSSAPKVNDFLEPSTSNMTCGGGSETIDSAETSCWIGNEADRDIDVSMSEATRDGCNSKEGGTIVGCSVRDLMRRKRKRCYQIEQPQGGTPWVDKVSSDTEQIESLVFCTKERNVRQDTGLLGSSLCGPSPMYDGTVFQEGNMYLGDSALGIAGEACGAKTNDRDSLSELPLLSSDDNSLTANTDEHGHFIPGLSLPCHFINMETDPCQLFGMTIYKKPPVIEREDEILGKFTLSSGFPCPCPEEESNYARPSVEGRIADEFLPFFAEDFPIEEEAQNVSCRLNDLNCTREVLGVPTHYQNDGSFLYILTPVFSPPSTDDVHRWVLHDRCNVNTIRDNGNEQVVWPSLPKGSSQDSESDYGSKSDAKPKQDLDQLNKHDQGSQDVEREACPDDVTTLLQCEGDILKVKQPTVCSQDLSQISGPDRKSKLTPLSQMGFRDPASVGGGQQLTLISIEVLTESRGDLRPDPQYDAINVVVIVIQEDDNSAHDKYVLLRCNTETVSRNSDGISGCKVLISSEECHLFGQFIRIICSLDPDVLVGWDIQGASLGFLAERAAHLGIGLLNNISRTPSDTNVVSSVCHLSENRISSEALPESFVADPALLENSIIEDEWGRTHASGIHVGGRVVLNIWRLVRSEVKLTMYTLEAVAEAVLRQKFPSIPCKILKKWFSSGPGVARYRCIEYVLERAKLNLQIINQLDMINRTSQLARVFGIDFFSVLSRGSQYRVESMFLRLAHTQNYLAISPGSQQVASQPAMECLPLVMEPESGFYADPVVVLDFQSLYPSMIIAYNLCFCTCLGKVLPSKANTLGVSSYSPDLNVLRKLKNQILLTPNGVMYVPSKVRKGVLPRLLEEILLTRIMVKQAMKKLDPSQKVLHRIFNARQLALKLIANVTYGYTAAGFSGRMPCAELADSIVQCARGTLENAILFVNTHDKWKGRVIYGDTDSMFVLLKGRTVKEAFQIGHEIASAVTAMNPNPVTLKMEKVYHPCFLLTKKRYVGYSYESPDQSTPVFDAKGVETVRRDTCAAVSKTMERSLRIFFEHPDIDNVKSYLLRQWKRILSGRVSLQDFVFAKEVRLGTYSTRAASLPPAAIVATKAMRADPRAEPRYAEPIPYVVVHGEPGARLIDMVVDPLELLAIDSPFRLNDLYYITKQIIPALQRVFGLVGADLNQWFSKMPRPGPEAITKRQFFAMNPHRTRIDYYYLSKHCVLCGELVQCSAHICGKCSMNEAFVATVLTARTSKLEREIQHLAAICRQCGGGDWLVESGIKCTSLACSVFYERRKIQKELQSLSAVATEDGFYPRCMVEWF